MGLQHRNSILKSPNVLFKITTSPFHFVTNIITLQTIIVAFSSLYQVTNCEKYQLIRPESSQYDYFIYNYNDDIRLPYDKRHTTDEETNSLTESTPILDSGSIISMKNKRHTQNRRTYSYNSQVIGPDNYDERNSISSIDIKSISPAKVIEGQHYIYGPDFNLFSPIFNLQTLDFNLAHISYPQLNNYQAQPIPAQNSFDSSNDLIELGSGNWDSSLPPEDSSNVLEDTTRLIQSGPSSVSPTQVLTPSLGTLATPLPQDQNRAPTLIRRLPKLAIISGQFWRFYIPSDTFLDEDGDLRQLRSRILRRNPILSNFIDGQETNVTQNSNQESFDQFYSWLQYDQNSLLLYGFPTENDVGTHELVLEVTDRWGSSSSETIEIHVKQHQSTRAFTHSIVINRVDWDVLGYQSMIDGVSELIRRISAKVYSDLDFKNLILQYYALDKLHKTNSNGQSWPNDDSLQGDSRNNNMSFTIAWSNGSLPIHPCNLSHIENLIKPLIAYQNLSLLVGDKIEVEPSQNLTKAIGPEFRLTNISIHLQGACEIQDSSSNKINEHMNTDQNPKTQIKVGKLNWRLGEPIKYQIPAGTFSDENGSHLTRGLELTVHTIDGLLLDKDLRYNFLEFDSETQTLYGLPYSQENHAGQRELLLTARHPKSGKKAREVFIVNIAPQDLTSINNRAFRMSLYLSTRTGLFGPKERVSLSKKILRSLRAGEPNFDHDQLSPELIVMGVQKFAIRNRADYISSEPSGSDSYQDDIVGLVDTVRDDQVDSFYVSKEEFRRDEAPTQAQIFYKFTWTNETIGYRGDCPVEVIKENILYALEQSMLRFKFVGPLVTEDSTKNDSAKFYDRLRLYFEPESNLIHLRFEPLGACISALEVHDVGNNALADNVDSQTNQPFLVDLTTPNSVPPVISGTEIDSTNEEYWSIVVLIILVVVLIFVIIMFFMGMHTYKINQDKRFELQARLAQARQNSMYLSSMILANHASPNDMLAPGVAKSICDVHEEEKGSRRPVILDKEKQLLSGYEIPTQSMRFTAVQHHGSSYETTSIQPNMSLALNPITNGWQQGINIGPTTVMHGYVDGKQQSATLHRIPSSSMRRKSRQNTLISGMNPSQSILTVASLAGPVLPITTQTDFPVIYAQVPLDQPPQSYSMSLQRGFTQHGPALSPDLNTQKASSYMISKPGQNLVQQPTSRINNQRATTTNNLTANDSNHNNKFRSPSYSSSTSATTQSVISNSNYQIQTHNNGPTNAL